MKRPYLDERIMRRRCQAYEGSLLVSSPYEEEYFCTRGVHTSCLYYMCKDRDALEVCSSELSEVLGCEEERLILVDDLCEQNLN
jgi:hypothetical protein